MIAQLITIIISINTSYNDIHIMNSFSLILHIIT